MQCPRCGTNNADTNAYCAQCGVALPPAATAAAQAQGATPPTVPSPAAAPAPAPAYRPPANYLPAQQPPTADTRVPGWYAPPAPSVPSTTAGEAARRPALPPFGSPAAVPGPPRYLTTCGVCGAALYGGQAVCLRCQTPPGTIVNPNDPTATQYLPFGPHVPLIPLFRSGEPRAETADRIPGWQPRRRPDADRLGREAPDQVAARRLRTPDPPAYRHVPDAGRLHRASESGILTGYLFACVLIFALPRSLYLGLNGNTLAWRSGLFADRVQLQKAQRTWTLWAIIGVTVLAALLGVAAAALSAA